MISIFSALVFFFGIFYYQYYCFYPKMYIINKYTNILKSTFLENISKQLSNYDINIDLQYKIIEIIQKNIKLSSFIDFDGHIDNYEQFYIFNGTPDEIYKNITTDTENYILQDDYQTNNFKINKFRKFYLVMYDNALNMINQKDMILFCHLLNETFMKDIFKINHIFYSKLKTILKKFKNEDLKYTYNLDELFYLTIIDTNLVSILNYSDNEKINILSKKLHDIDENQILNCKLPNGNPCISYL